MKKFFNLKNTLILIAIALIAIAIVAVIAVVLAK